MTAPLTYDDEMLDAHFITGDGRGNENIGLTAVHTIFHSEHNRLVDANKVTILATGDRHSSTSGCWRTCGGTGDRRWPQIGQPCWDGERLFQAAPLRHRNAVPAHGVRGVRAAFSRSSIPSSSTQLADLDPAIVAEFAHAVYRFGHSMLTDTIDRLKRS